MTPAACDVRALAASIAARSTDANHSSFTSLLESVIEIQSDAA